MAEKSEALTKYKEYEAWLQTQFKSKIKRLQSDRGGEYKSSDFDTHLKSQGTVRSLTVHDTPEQNGISEHYNCIVAKCMLALLKSSGLLKFL